MQPNLVLEGDHGAAEVYVGLHVKVFKSKKVKGNLAMYLFCRKIGAVNVVYSEFSQRLSSPNSMYKPTTWKNSPSDAFREIFFL